MTAAHKKHTTTKKVTKKVTPEKKPESISDVVQPEVPQPANLVGPALSVPVNPQPVPPAESVAPVLASEHQPASFAPAVSTPSSADPLTDFKEKMSEEEQVSSFAPPKKNFMWPILFVFIIALALLGGIFIYKQSINKGTEVNVVKLSVTPTLAPEPTKAEIDLSKYPIKILNGSELEGEAGRQKSNLEEKGFTVSSVGNAKNSDYTKTIIQAKKDVDKDFLDKLKSVLEESFVVGEIEELPQDADSNVIIIIGGATN